MVLASPLAVVVVNRSTVVTDADATRTAAALHVQLNRDFAPYWGIDGVVTAAKTVPRGAMPLYLLDDSDQAGALGYHDNDVKLGPFGRVFAKTDQKFGLKWSVTASHELLELVADAFVFAGAQVNSTTWTAVEVADPVEADADGYVIDGVWVSDFVTPAWYAPGQPGPWDYRQFLKAPFTLRKGGYVSLWTQKGGWTQKHARPVPGEVSRARFAHRRSNRLAAAEAFAASMGQGERQVVEEDGTPLT